MTGSTKTACKNGRGHPYSGIYILFLSATYARIYLLFFFISGDGFNFRLSIYDVLLPAS